VAAIVKNVPVTSACALVAVASTLTVASWPTTVLRITTSTSRFTPVVRSGGSSDSVKAVPSSFAEQRPADLFEAQVGLSRVAAPNVHLLPLNVDLWGGIWGKPTQTYTYLPSNVHLLDS
jgi:hypothetical protein